MFWTVYFYYNISTFMVLSISGSYFSKSQGIEAIFGLSMHIRDERLRLRQPCSARGSNVGPVARMRNALALTNASMGFARIYTYPIFIDSYLISIVSVLNIYSINLQNARHINLFILRSVRFYYVLLRY